MAGLKIKKGAKKKPPQVPKIFFVQGLLLLDKKLFLEDSNLQFFFLCP